MDGDLYKVFKRIAKLEDKINIMIDNITLGFNKIEEQIRNINGILSRKKEGEEEEL
jgi:hypothetical protein